jgi:N-acylneuraminate cytidylyltransferase/CMP-N,N'-diacetyllegionaminic acid synthase
MINNSRVLAIIPARGGSKGFPGKNIVPLAGKPLIGWPIHAAKNSQYIDRIIVSTDDSNIASVAKKEGAEVPFTRPNSLATDEASTFSVIEHTLNYCFEKNDYFDYVILLESTSPLTEADDIDQALEKLVGNRKVADSIVGVSKVEAAHPVFDVTISNDTGLIEPFLEDFAGTVRRQDISELYFYEGSVYISDIEILLGKKGFYHHRTLPYVVPKWKAFEVDDIVDLLCIESIMKNLSKIKNVFKND